MNKPKVTEKDIVEFCRISKTPIFKGFISDENIEKIKQFIYNRNKARRLKKNPFTNFKDYL